MKIIDYLNKFKICISQKRKEESFEKYQDLLNFQLKKSIIIDFQMSPYDISISYDYFQLFVRK